eukprot:m.143332 g.143332  ORF g.143332 m.143332 type:complete len:416 (-) comp14088_c0_seq8:106-1353(-)
MIEFPIQFTLTYLCFLRCVARARPRSYAGGTGHHIVDYDEPQMSPFQQRSSLSQGQKASPAPLDDMATLGLEEQRVWMTMSVRNSLQISCLLQIKHSVDGCDRDVQSDDGLWPNGISPPAITNQLVPPSFSEQPSTSPTTSALHVLDCIGTGQPDTSLEVSFASLDAGLDQSTLPSDAVDVSAMAHHDEYISVAHDDSETEQGGNEGAFQRDGDSMHDQQHGASGDGGVRGSSREGSDHQSHGHGAGDDVPSQLQAVARSETDPEQGQNIADCEPDDEEVATALSFVHQSQQARPFLKFGFDTPGHSSPNTVATSSVGWRSSTSSIATDISEAEAAARPFHVIKAIADSLTSSDLVIPLCASFVTEEEWSDHPHRGSDSPPLNVDVMVSTQREALPNDSAPVAALCSSTRPDLFL